MDNKGIRGEIAKYQRFQNNDALKIELTLKIVGAIKGNPQIRQEEMVSTLNIPRRTLQRKMLELQEKGKIIRVDGKRYGHWEIQQ